VRARDQTLIALSDDDDDDVATSLLGIREP
jgi:hypothetical protein